MLLSTEQTRAFQAHLLAVGARLCPLCRAATDWPATAELVAVPTYVNFKQGLKPVRSIRCVCPGCAFVVAFDAVQLDIGTREIADMVANAFTGS